MVTDSSTTTALFEKHPKPMAQRKKGSATGRDQETLEQRHAQGARRAPSTGYLFYRRASYRSRSDGASEDPLHRIHSHCMANAIPGPAIAGGGGREGGRGEKLGGPVSTQGKPQDQRCCKP